MWGVGGFGVATGILQEIAIQSMQERRKTGSCCTGPASSLSWKQRKLRSVPREVGQRFVQPPKKLPGLPEPRLTTRQVSFGVKSQRDCRNSSGQSICSKTTLAVPPAAADPFQPEMLSAQPISRLMSSGPSTGTGRSPANRGLSGIRAHRATASGQAPRSCGVGGGGGSCRVSGVGCRVSGVGVSGADRSSRPTGTSATGLAGASLTRMQLLPTLTPVPVANPGSSFGSSFGTGPMAL